MDMDNFIAEAGWDEYAEDATQEVHRVQERDVESIQEENTQRIQAHEGDSCQLYRVLEVLSNVDYVFAVQEAPEALLLLLQHSDNRPFLQVVQLVVGWLHAIHHLPVRVCRLLLRVLWLAFARIAPGGFPPVDSTASTLPTFLWRLDFKVRFRTLPVCSRCRDIAPHDSPRDALCRSYLLITHQNLRSDQAPSIVH